MGFRDFSPFAFLAAFSFSLLGSLFPLSLRSGVLFGFHRTAGFEWGRTAALRFFFLRTILFGEPGNPESSCQLSPLGALSWLLLPPLPPGGHFSLCGKDNPGAFLSPLRVKPARSVIYSQRKFHSAPSFPPLIGDTPGPLFPLTHPQSGSAHPCAQMKATFDLSSFSF